ncbi:MAG TPA: membrane protein insertase YidC [Usitatibacter sp.]|nr:membrane protein insertase YidC [Usitatibacter sp.]
MNTIEIRRIILLVIFSFSALMLWDAWQKHEAALAPKLPPTSMPALPAASEATAPKAPTAASTPAVTPATAASPSAGPVAPAGQTVTVKTDLFDVEINTAGGDIRRVTMKKQHSALDSTRPLTLMEPDPQHYFVTQTGLLGDGMPNHKSAYQAGQLDYTLGDGKESVAVRLKALDANGVEVTKVFTFKRDSYVIDVAYEVANRTDKPIAPFAYFQFLRDSNPPGPQAAPTSKFGGVNTFTGPAVYTEESHFVKVTFKDVDSGKLNYPKKAKDGWIAIVQHYFVSAWLPKDGKEREYFTNKVGDNLYTAGVVEPVGTIAPGATARVDVPAYIGPQETERLEHVAPGLKLVVDYGWLYVLAAPIFTVLKWIHGVVGNWGWSIILLTIIIKALFYPLNAKAGRSMAQMKVLAPKMEKLKEIYGEDRQKLNLAMMELYKTEKINPLGGCLPILVQIPVFIALYWVLLASIELRHAPWLGWIQDLSAPDPYFILPVIYAVSMFVQTRLNPQPADPVQAKVMLAMPIVFSVFFLFFPAGLVLYWVVQNLLSILQQWHINKTLAAEAAAKARR